MYWPCGCPRLRHESIGHAAQLIVNEATRAFAEMPGSAAAKRQAFVGAGWARFPQHGDDLRPFGITITNALTQDGWLPGAQPEFVGDVRILTDDSPYLWTDVGGLPAGRHAKLNRAIRNQVERGLSARALADLLIRETRQMADLNERIGRGLMVSSIPRSVTETGELIALASLPTDTKLTFAHLRHDDSLAGTEGPHVVRPGGVVFSNFRHEQHGHSETVSVTIVSPG